MTDLPIEHTVVFASGTEGYHTFRIPSIIVTKDGAVLAFCEGRSNRADHSHNKIVLKTSRDGGKTWDAARIIADDGGVSWSCGETAPDDLAGMAGEVQMVELSDGTLLLNARNIGGERLLFSNPAHEKNRVNGVVRMSADEGRSWPLSVEVESGRFAYSCLTVMLDGNIGCLYETRGEDPYEKIVLARFGVGDLR